VAQSASITRNTLAALEGVVRSKADLPGRKVLFFISDGFELNLRDPDGSIQLQRVVDSAARSGFVIYTLDARGLATQPSFEANRSTVLDDTQSVERSNAGELNATQQPLYTLAADTGGRALFNSNALTRFVPRVLQETSRYYLLAWTPDQGAAGSGRFHRVEVSVSGEPELIVRAPRGFYEPLSPTDRRRAPSSRAHQPAAAQPAQSAGDADLLAALRAPYPVGTLQTKLSLSFMDIPNIGTVLATSTMLDASALDFGVGDTGLLQASMEVVSAVFDDQGKGVASVKQRVTIDTGSRRATYNHSFRLKPGLYQVRVAARDSRTGKVGSAMEWIEIPSRSGGPLSMSNLIMERGAEPRLRFLTYVYNAARAPGLADVVMKVQVLRDNKPVIATPLSRLKTDGNPDVSRLPYFAEVDLQGMPAGDYILQVIAIDRATGASASQRADFEIE